MTTATTATYMNRVIGGPDALDGSTVTDGDRVPGHVEVCVSVGQFDEGLTMIEVFFPGEYANIGLNFTAAHKLMLALQDALNIHASQSE